MATSRFYKTQFQKNHSRVGGGGVGGGQFDPLPKTFWL